MKSDPWQMLRYALVGFGGALAGNGSAVTDGEMQTLAGAIVAIASCCWGIYVRWNTAAVPKDVASSPIVPVKSSLTGEVHERAGA